MALNYLWSYIFRKDEDKWHLKLLKELPLCEGFSQAQLMKLSELLHLRMYRKGEVVFREHEPGESMFIIKKGQVRLYQGVASGKDNDIAILEQGTFFGEVSLVDPESRSASAIAMSDSELLVLFRGDLLSLNDRDPRLSSFIFFRLSQVISKRLRLMLNYYGEKVTVE